MHQLRCPMSEIRINNIYKISCKNHIQPKNGYRCERKPEGESEVSRLKNLLKANWSLKPSARATDPMLALGLASKTLASLSNA